MICRNNLFTAAAVTATLIAAGCAAPKPARFAMPFAPPPATPREVNITTEPPPPLPNLFLNNETPNPVLERYRVASIPTPSDLAIARAEEAYQRGRRYYQSGDKERARGQFDHAVEFLFDASEHATDRSAFER